MHRPFRSGALNKAEIDELLRLVIVLLFLDSAVRLVHVVLELSFLLVCKLAIGAHPSLFFADLRLASLKLGGFFVRQLAALDALLNAVLLPVLSGIDRLLRLWICRCCSRFGGCR